MGEKEHDFLEDQALNPALDNEPADAGSTGTVDTPADGTTTAAAATPPAEGTPPATGATTAPNPPDGHVPLAALMAERDKRQEASRKAEEYERELAALRQQREQQEPAPSFWDGPEQHVQQAVMQVQMQAQDRLFAALEAQAREVHPDYDEVFKEVEEQALQNPTLRAEILSAPNPALAAYKLGKKLLEQKEVLADPVAYRARVEAEVRAKLEQEAKDKAAADAKVAASIPPDITDTRSARTDGAAPPESVFDEIFNKP